MERDIDIITAEQPCRRRSFSVTNFLFQRKLFFATAIALVYSCSFAQSRKHASNFSVFQQYYNPAFTGFTGSTIKTYYRNQWAGFEGAPKTFLISAEINLADYARKSAPILEGNQAPRKGVQHALGISILHDTFGPFVESQIFGSYKSMINLSEKVRLQSGAAIVYHAQTLDGNKLTSDEANDPSLQQYVNRTSRSGKMDFNIGVALSGRDFYLGYGMQNIRGAVGSRKDFFSSNSTIQQVVQAGYRRAVSDKVGFIFNGLFRFDKQLKETIEGQLKGVFYNAAWIGVGYRSSLAYSLSAGFRMNQWQIGYGYEIPTGKAQMTGSGTNEIMVTYDLKQIIDRRSTRQISIW